MVDAEVWLGAIFASVGALFALAGFFFEDDGYAD
jgi:hypothetical protein